MPVIHTNFSAQMPRALNDKEISEQKSQQGRAQDLQVQGKTFAQHLEANKSEPIKKQESKVNPIGGTSMLSDSARKQLMQNKEEKKSEILTIAGLNAREESHPPTLSIKASVANRLLETIALYK